MGLASLVLKDYGPTAVSNITGVPSRLILQIGREFASTRPALGVCSTSSEYQWASSPFGFMAFRDTLSIR